MAAILVNSFSAGAAIKQCPTASSYGKIEIDLSNLLNIKCQKSLNKNSNRFNHVTPFFEKNLLNLLEFF